MAASVVASLNGSRLGCRGTSEDLSLLRTRCDNLAGRCAEHILTVLGNTLNGNVLMFPLLEAEKHWLQPAPSLITTGFSHGWHLLSAHLFQPVSFFLLETTGWSL